jgi:hypothetical protein
VPIIMVVVNAVGTAAVTFDAQAGNYQTPATGPWSFDIFVTATTAAPAVPADLTNTARIMFVITWSDTKQP